MNKNEPHNITRLSGRTQATEGTDDVQTTPATRPAAKPPHTLISELLDGAYDDQLETVPPEPIDGASITAKTLAKLGSKDAETNGWVAASATSRAAARANAKTRAQARHNRVSPTSGPTSGSASDHARDNTRSHTRNRLFKIAAAAAALMLITVATAVAATNALRLEYQPIDFGGRVLAIHGIPVGDVEVSGTALGQSVQLDGVAVSFDTVAADDNFIVAYFTLVFDEPLDLDAAVADERGGDPYRVDGYDAYKLWYYLPPVSLVANGIELGRADMDLRFKEAASFMPDERTIKFAVRYLVPTLLPDVFTLRANLLPSTARGINKPALNEPANFTTSVDKSTVTKSTQLVEPGLYTFQTVEGPRYLDIEKLASSPFGTVLTVRRHWTEDGSLDGRYLGNDSFSAADFKLFDDKGNELGTFSYSSPDDGSPYTSYEIRHSTLTPQPDDPQTLDDDRSALISNEDIGALTIVPVVEPLGTATGPRTYSVQDIGAKIPVSATSGYYLEDYRVESSKIIIVARSYGMNGTPDYLDEFQLDDDGLVTLTENYRSGRIEEDYDPATGMYTITHSYYAATNEELLSIESFKVYYWGNPVIDTAAGQTLVLMPRG
ncbi:MAG: hypothetical protein LBU31_00615 [Coriobacteriales bacterium]|jgi:hypothetical protein|nr:hypothetical protein [Coriobacteriales bacterium]